MGTCFLGFDMFNHIWQPSFPENVLHVQFKKEWRFTCNVYFPEFTTLSNKVDIHTVCAYIVWVISGLVIAFEIKKYWLNVVVSMYVSFVANLDTER